MDSFTVCDHVIKLLEQSGIDTVFGVPGGLISPMYAALEKSSVRVITAKHECNAVWMAAGYAHETRLPGVALVTAGPGVTNAITGVATALTERLPVIIFGGEVPRSAFGRGALQETSSHTFDAVRLMSSVTKFSRQAVRPESAVALVQRALFTARSGSPGPVFLSIPVDVGAAPASKPCVFGSVNVSLQVDETACERAFAQLEAAERPLIVAGAGARAPGCRSALRALAEAIDAPVVVTPKGKGVFPERDRRYLGVFGFGGHESVVEYLRQEPDVIVVCGAGLNDFSTNAWSPLLQPKGSTFIHIDVDVEHFGRSYQPDIALLGSVDRVVEVMLRQRGGVRHRSSVPPSKNERAPADSGTGRLNGAEVMFCLNEMVQNGSTYTVDMGEHLAFALHYLSLADRTDFMTCLGFGAMGSSVPFGIGIALAKKERRTYVLVGDGGMLLSGTELNTIAKWAAPISFLVFNDGRLNMCHWGMLDRYCLTNDFSNHAVNFAAFAEACGVSASVVETRAQLAAALQTSQNQASPELIDMRIDPEVRLLGSQRTAALRQFTEVPNPRAVAGD